MEYISAEEFLKQDKEVQEVFINWMNNNLNNCDLVVYNNKIMLYKDYINRPNSELKCFSIKLLTEGDIRKFIEDKTNCIITILYSPKDKCGYCIDLNKKEYNKVLGKQLYFQERFKNLGNNLLQAYWKVSVKIIKEYILK